MLFCSVNKYSTQYYNQHRTPLSTVWGIVLCTTMMTNILPAGYPIIHVRVPPSLAPRMAISRQKVTSRALRSAEYHRQNCPLHTFGQFGAVHWPNTVICWASCLTLNQHCASVSCLLDTLYQTQDVDTMLG